MTRYELARDKRVTIAAVVLEGLMVVACVLLVDSINAEFFKVQTMLASHVPLKVALVVVALLQYGIVATELVARHRVERRGWTIPLVFLPGGIVFRSALMFMLCGSVVIVKMAVYFVSVLLEFVFQLLHISRLAGTATLVDLADRALEPLEMGVNRVYNALYYSKIVANSSVFTSVFNGTLSLWCINH